jgi:diaminohydroxyphosphoribosylaminopyrimidine deaminase/5-amino-6-(5-phosphoribosylamino)uracil reductase
VDPDPNDVTFMRLALRAALRGAGRTCPNPAVGAVVVREGRVVATGHHACAGAPHAEAAALEAAGGRAKGAALYVTLEPCCHTGRTPPCADTILDAGVAEVVYAARDPSPHCDGRGATRLAERGVRVRPGVLAEEARRLNGPFFKRVETGLPFVTAKWAMTLDGKTAARGGDSRWITSPAARALVHRFRRRAGAVLVGLGTVLADDPRLTCRLPGDRQPVRVVADPEAETPPDARLIESVSVSPLLVAHGPDAPAGRVRRLAGAGAKTLEVAGAPGGIDLEGLFRSLAEGACGLGAVDHVFLEGGGELAASAFEAGLVDRVEAFVAPKVLGGREAKTPVEGEGPDRIADARPVEVFRVRTVGGDFLVEGTVRRSSPSFRATR